MRTRIRHLVGRAGQLLLGSIEQEQRDLKHQVLSRLKTLDRRVESALEQARADARLLSARARTVRSPGRLRGLTMPRHATELAPSRYPARIEMPWPAEIVELTACPACGQQEWTPVCEFNRFLVVDSAPDPHAARYDYALCHHCGVVFARHRPVGTRYRTFLVAFEETLGRARKDGEQAHLLGSGPLSPAAETQLRTSLSAGMFVSEAAGPAPRTARTLVRDRLAAAAHVEVLGALLDLRAPRVLELRPRFGAIGAALRRLYGGSTFALPLFEVQQWVARHVYGTTADALLDYDRFTIPYDGPFDLIVGNHMLTHAVRPAEFLATVRAALRPGGHLYLYNEPDEGDFLAPGGKSMFKTLNPFHLQTFDAASLDRVLRLSGFEPLFLTHHGGNCVVLARVAPAEAPPVEPQAARARRRRLARYAQARDRAILLLPPDLRGTFAEEWEAVIERAFAGGVIDFDRSGALRLVR